MKYATKNDVTVRYSGSASEAKINNLLEEAGVIIDAYNEDADEDNKKIVSVRMVVRALGSDADIPIGATQGTVSALGYSQTWSMASNSTTGELYLTRIEKKLLGCGAKIGSRSPLEAMNERYYC